jgi:hypothetical protein
MKKKNNPVECNKWNESILRVEMEPNHLVSQDQC